MTEGQSTGGVWNLNALIAASGTAAPLPGTEPLDDGPHLYGPAVAEPVDPWHGADPAVPGPDVPGPVADPAPPPETGPQGDGPHLDGPHGNGPSAAPRPVPVRARGRIRLTTRTILGLAVAAAFLVAGSGVAVPVMHRGPVPAPVPAPALTYQPAPPADTGTPSLSPVPSQLSTVDVQLAALQTLQRLRDGDVGTVALDGSYVAQLASKIPGIVDPYQTAADGTHTFQASDILAEHLALRQTDNLGARVVLLLSTDYGHRQLYQGQPLWVTMALGPFGSAVDVQRWCARRFPALTGTVLDDYCTARRLEPIGG